MGLLMFLGMIGSVAYMGHLAKNEIQAELIDRKTSSINNSMLTNKQKIYSNFDDICKRSGIKIVNKAPINDEKIGVAIEYLKYQGYTEADIRYFKEIFYKKIDHEVNREQNILKLKQERLLYKIRNNPSTEKIIIRKSIYRSILSPEDRMNKLLQNKVWRKIVVNKSYIKGGSGVKFEEIWTIKVPKNFFADITQDELYRNVCKMQKVEYRL